MGPMGFGFYPEEAKELLKATRNLAITLWNLNDKLRRKYDEKAAEEVTKALEAAVKQIEEITKNLKE
jgi:glycogen synthase